MQQAYGLHQPCISQMSAHFMLLYDSTARYQHSCWFTVHVTLYCYSVRHVFVPQTLTSVNTLNQVPLSMCKPCLVGACLRFKQLQ